MSGAGRCRRKEEADPFSDGNTNTYTNTWHNTCIQITYATNTQKIHIKYESYFRYSGLRYNGAWFKVHCGHDVIKIRYKMYTKYTQDRIHEQYVQHTYQNTQEYKYKYQYICILIIFVSIYIHAREATILLYDKCILRVFCVYVRIHAKYTQNTFIKWHTWNT